MRECPTRALTANMAIASRQSFSGHDHHPSVSRSRHIQEEYHISKMPSSLYSAIRCRHAMVYHSFLIDDANTLFPLMLPPAISCTSPGVVSSAQPCHAASISAIISKARKAMQPACFSGLRVSLSSPRAPARTGQVSVVEMSIISPSLLKRLRPLIMNASYSIHAGSHVVSIGGVGAFRPPPVIRPACHARRAVSAGHYRGLNSAMFLYNN